MRTALFLVAMTALAGAESPKDRFVPAPYGAQRVGGFLGERLRVNLEHRLLKTDEEHLLAGFEHRPGKQEYIGEHVGKFLDAASNAYEYSRNAELKALMDRMAARLLKTQLPDGYMGTYTDDQRWTSWDVWVHKYALLGLLRYHEVSGSEPALEAGRHIGDLLGRAFGDGPGQRELVRVGKHGGLASTSVLESVCKLYRHTREPRYLEFAHHLLRQWDLPRAPAVLRTLLESGSVYRTGNGKAYEILSNVVGLVELYRLTGDSRFLTAAERAWQDVRERRMYITGTASSHEHFRDDHSLPGLESSRVGEGCVTVTWEQLNWHLLRLSGEARYAEELERTVYNQLLGAQDPQNGDICYFTPLIGQKRPSAEVTCCLSSESRGISMIPQLAWGLLDGDPALMLYAAGDVNFGDVKLAVKTDYPLSGRVSVSVTSSRLTPFGISFRVPAWTKRFEARAGGRRFVGTPGQYLRIQRDWRTSEVIDIDMDLTVRRIPGGPSYEGFTAVARGPQVLALERSANPDVPHLHLAALAPGEVVLRSPKPGLYEAGGLAVRRGAVRKTRLRLVPFSEARDHRVWLTPPERLSLAPVPVTAFGRESWSAKGLAEGSVCDERPETYRNTAGRRFSPEDWYAVEFSEPRPIRRVVFRHGHNEAEGGWFDTSSGKPQVQLRSGPKAAWVTVAALEDYPAAAGAAPPLRDGQLFEVRLKDPLPATGVRVVGMPGGQGYSSCAEVAAYEE